MVEVAVTERHSNVPRALSDHKFLCSVAFYPGCGEFLGFGAKVASSFWRPLRPMQLHMGMCDPFYPNCLARKNLAAAAANADGHPVPLVFTAYPGARHHFDALSQTWSPKSTRGHPSEVGDDVGDASLSADRSAMRAADVAALDFFLSVFQASPPALM